MPEMLREVKRTVSVYLNEKGVHTMRGTPYLRDDSFLACSRIIDDASPHYLFAEVRYYKGDSKLPRYSCLSIPHAYVKYMVSEHPFHEKIRVAVIRRDEKGLPQP